MIDWNKSAELNDKSIDWLKKRFDRFPGSQFKIVAVCDGCGTERILNFFNYNHLCRKCGCIKRSADPEYIKTRDAMFNGDDWKMNNANARKRLYEDEEYIKSQIDGCRRNAKNKDWIARNLVSIKKLAERNANDSEFGERVSAGRQHVPFDDWIGYSIDDRYGIPTNVYDIWRRSVYKRDDYICKLCGEARHAVHAHHIRKQSLYPESVLDINNGITMCKKCHESTYGKEELFAEELQMMICGDV